MSGIPSPAFGRVASLRTHASLVRSALRAAQAGSDAFVTRRAMSRGATRLEGDRLCRANIHEAPSTRVCVPMTPDDAARGGSRRRAGTQPGLALTGTELQE